jgi:RND family efflux transporter MFP subunit
LVIDRSEPSRLAPRRHALTRYVIPAGLLLGFAGVLAGTAWDTLLPRRPVTVVPVLMTEALVQRAGTPLFKAAGWLQPRPWPIRVPALAPGVVAELLVVEDQPVKAGEPIARLVDADARLARDRALADQKLRQAELAEARAALAAARTRYESPVHLEATLGEAEAALATLEVQRANLPFELRRAQSRLTFARRDLDNKSAASSAVAARSVELARSDLESAQALVEELTTRQQQLDREQAALIRRRNALQRQLELKVDEQRARDEAEAQVNAALARVEEADVALAQAQLQLQRMTVCAPADGRVLHLLAEPGTRLMADVGHKGTHDASTVVTLYQPDKLQARVDVRFEDLRRVRVGQPVQIESPAVSAPLRGTVLFISSLADNQKNTLEVKVAIDTPPQVFKPEMLVDVTFLAPPSEGRDTAAAPRLHLYVPPVVVRQDEQGPFVLVADQSAGVARRVRIETGATTGELIEITKGLTASSRLIAGGSEGLRDGDRIRVTGES